MEARNKWHNIFQVQKKTIFDYKLYIQWNYPLVLKRNKDILRLRKSKDFPGGPVAKAALPMQGAQVWSHMPQLKILHASTNIWCSQINKQILKKKKERILSLADLPLKNV